MFFDASIPPDPEDPGGSGVDRGGWVPPVPDALDLVVDAADMVAVFAAQRLQRVDAMRREALADAARHGLALTEVIERSVRLELACALRITEYAAGEMITLADALVHRYPTVLDSLSHAQMTEEHARILVRFADEVEPDLREQVVSRGVVLAEAEPVGTFRRAMRTLVEKTRVKTLVERHEAAVTQRRVVEEQAHDGMSWLHAYIPTVEAHAIHGRLTAMGKNLTAQDGDDRSLDQVRADVFCDLLIDGDTTTHPDQTQGIRASVVVTVPALAILDDDASDADPAVVEGIGPIPIDKARELCGGSDGWMRVLTHPETGMVLSVGRDRYPPPEPLRRLVKWRADRCMAPGCTVPASRCEIDHNIAWIDGGHTCLENNCPFCKGHHIVKHHGGWTVSQLPDTGGAIEWISPTGRRYVVEPERRVPVFRPDPADTERAPF